VRRLLPAACLAAVLLIGCGGGTKTVTRTQTQPPTASTTGTTSTVVTETTVTATTPTQTTVTATEPVPQPSPSGNHGPHYFETPSHNIGCFIDSGSARCDIRERTWNPPPKPQYCIKAGVDWGQGVGFGEHRAEFVCAGDTVLGGPGLLGYGHTAQRGTTVCLSRTVGITCRNSSTGHGFFLSRTTYRLF
jgi:hypothetical protein